MKRYILGIFTLFIIVSIKSQDTDSLYKQISTVKNDTLSSLVYLDIAKEIYYSYPDSAKILVNKSLEIGKITKNYFIIANSYKFLGIINDVKGKWSDALSDYNKAYVNAELANSKKLKADILHNIGMIYSNIGDSENAIIYYHNALTLYEKLNNQEAIAITLSSISYELKKQGRHNKALEYLRNALAIGIKNNDDELVGMSYSQISRIFFEQKEIDSSFHYINLAIIKKEKTNNYFGLAKSYITLGELYKYKEQPQNATKYFLKSLSIFQKIENKNLFVPVLIQLADIYSSSSLYDRKKAEKYYFESEKLAKSSQTTNNLISIYHGLGKLYQKEKMYQLSNDYLLKRITLHDSLYIISRDEKIIEIQTKYEVEKKQQKIALLKTENSIKQQKLKVRNYLIISLILILIIIIGISYHLKQKSINKLQNIENELQKYILQVNNSESKKSEFVSKNLVDKFDLSEREIDVFLLLKNGLTYQTISEELYISKHTVKYHIQNIYLKLDVKNKTDAIKKTQLSY